MLTQNWGNRRNRAESQLLPGFALLFFFFFFPTCCWVNLIFSYCRWISPDWQLLWPVTAFEFCIFKLIPPAATLSLNPVNPRLGLWLAQHVEQEVEAEVKQYRSMVVLLAQFKEWGVAFPWNGWDFRWPQSAVASSRVSVPGQWLNLGHSGDSTES